ncbi:hypothetical protein [Sphingobium amiense]|uniref:hypothetical protein n=1 Tax=Sphingobium amiense TaxID=135719 RepID=UPI0018D5A181|nr:hypothetical protein [Sphingobium amiense]
MGFLIDAVVRRRLILGSAGVRNHINIWLSEMTMPAGGVLFFRVVVGGVDSQA